MTGVHIAQIYGHTAVGMAQQMSPLAKQIWQLQLASQEPVLVRQPP